MITSKIEFIESRPVEGEQIPSAAIPASIVHSAGKTDLIGCTVSLRHWLSCDEIPARIRAIEWEFSPPLDSVSEEWLWEPIAYSLAMSYMAEILESLYESPNNYNPVDPTRHELQFRETPTTRRCVESINNFRTFTDLIEPLWKWQMTAKTPSPGPEVLLDATERILEGEDNLVNNLALSVTVAIAQELFVQHWLAEMGEDSPWFLAGKTWVDYLSQKASEEITIGFNLDGSFQKRPSASSMAEGNAQLYKATSLPASTIRAIGVRVGTGTRKKKDFVSRMGYWHPWRSKKEVVWMTRNLLNEPPTTFLSEGNHARSVWWFPILHNAARSIIERSLDLSKPYFKYREITLPWFRQALAATVAVSASLNVFNFRSTVDRLSKLKPAAGEHPNYLTTEASTCLEGRKEKDGKYHLHHDFEIIKERRTNIVRDLQTALKSHSEYKKIVMLEAALLSWWHDLFFPVFYDISSWWSNSERFNPSVETAERVDLPPSENIASGWLKAPIALFARNKKRPSIGVPGVQEVKKTYPDNWSDDHNRQIYVAARGLDAEEGINIKHTGPALKTNPVVRLTVAGWYGYPRAGETVLALLDHHNPNDEMRMWCWSSVVAAIVAAQFVHGSVPRQDQATAIREALERRISEARKFPEEDEAVNLSDWIERYLACEAPFPQRR